MTCELGQLCTLSMGLWQPLRNSVPPRTSSYINAMSSQWPELSECENVGTLTAVVEKTYKGLTQRQDMKFDDLVSWFHAVDDAGEKLTPGDKVYYQRWASQWAKTLTKDQASVFVNTRVFLQEQKAEALKDSEK